MSRKATGADGKTIIIPSGYCAVQGNDGHMIADIYNIILLWYFLII